MLKIKGSTEIIQHALLKQKTGNSSDVKLDKRKRALEVLARKTVSYERKTKASLGKMGSFQLLIQLLSDMRPILPHSSWAVIIFSKLFHLKQFKTLLTDFQNCARHMVCL